MSSLQLLDRFFVHGVTTLLRTDCVRAVGGYDESLVYEDWDLWLRLAERYDFFFHDEIHAKYRRVPASLSNTLSRPNSPDRIWSDVLILEKCARSPRLGPRQSHPHRPPDRQARAQAGWLRRCAAVPAMARAFRALAR